MYVYGVPAGGKRIVFNNDISIMVPSGGWYHQKREEGSLGTVYAPRNNRPIGYRDGMFSIDDEFDSYAIGVKIAENEIDGKKFEDGKRQIARNLKTADKFQKGEVLYEDDEIFVARFYLKMSFGIELRSSYRSSNSGIDIYLYMGLVFTKRFAYTLTAGTSNDMRDPVEDGILCSIRQVDHVSGGAVSAAASSTQHIKQSDKPVINTNSVHTSAKPAKSAPPPDPEAEKKRAERVLNRRVDDFKDEALANLKQKSASASAEKIRGQLVALVEEPLKAAQDHQRSQAQQLSTASFFAFSLKKQLKQAIADDDAKIAKLKEYVQEACSLNNDAAVAMAYFIEHPGKSWDDLAQSDFKFANSNSGSTGYYGMVYTLKELGLVKEGRSSGWNAKTVHTFDKRLSFTWPKPTDREISEEALRLLYSSMGGDAGTSPEKMREDIRAALLKDINAKALPGKYYTPTKGEMEALKEQVYDALLCYEPATASELCQRDRGLADVSSQRVSSLLRQLMMEGRVVRNGTRYETA